MDLWDVTMIVLAGGKSSRMGRDKADLLWKGETFLECQIRKGRELGVGEILVSGYRGENCSAPRVMDNIPDKGPLGGLEACLRRSSFSRALVVTVDLPLLPVSELAALLEENRKREEKVTVLVHGNVLEPLVGVYETDLADPAVKAMSTGRGSVRDLLNLCGYGVYESQADERVFWNINRREDYEKLVKNI